MTQPAGSAPGHDVVRPFIMTGGRTESRRADVRFETLVARVSDEAPGHVPTEQVALLQLAADPISVAELAAELGLVIGVVTVLIDDLVTAGHLELHTAEPDDIDLAMLTAIADKVRSL